METSNLWESYTKTKDLNLREELIIHYLYLVKYVAGRLFSSYGNNVEYDDLVSYGVFGLIDAIDKYDLNRRVKFDTYAQLRIRGAIIDHLREIDWLPRSVRQKAKELEKIYFELENKFGRSVTDKEVAQHLGISIDDFFKKIQNVTTYSIISLDDFLDQKRDMTMDEPGIGGSLDTNIEESELVEVLSGEIKNLPEKEKKIITLYYYEGLTYKEIGKIMGISESRVSQLHTKAIIRLKSKLEKEY